MSALEKHNDLVIDAVTIVMQSIMDIEDDWDALSVVIDFSEGRCWSAYSYNGTDWLPNGWSISSLDFVAKMEELQNKMAEDEQRKWLKALIQITRADMNFSFDFEYDDPKRWTLDDKSADGIRKHLESLRPAKK